MRRQPVSACARTCMLIYTILFWISGFALLFIGLWMLLDPRRSYILDLVDFSEDDPLLKFAAYTAVITGAGTLIIGFFSCCGAIKAERCMLISFIIFIVLILLAEVTIGTLAIVYKQKFTGDRMEVYIANMSQNRYYRDKWVTPLMDAIQYYQQCCGGTGPRDYYNGFWYITNTQRGTRSFVPLSCCKQTQTARAWSIQPIDPMCPTYFYGTKAFNSSVYIEGCHERLQRWFDEQAVIFAAVGISFAAFQMIGIILAIVMLNQINDYIYLR
uniref:Tetraspanin n=1 Tax=Panagrellus redivivus TaxID=6233 RepID=A0A7E4W5F7_PANRE